MTRAENRDMMTAHIERRRNSGQTQKDYCRSEGLSLSKFHYWVKQNRIFDSKRERFISSTPEEQLSLFDIEKAEETTEDTKQETITYTRSKTKEKKQPLRAALPSHLPRKEEIIESDNIPEGAKKIGEAVTEILEYTPSKIYVRKIIRPKY